MTVKHHSFDGNKHHRSDSVPFERKSDKRLLRTIQFSFLMAFLSDDWRITIEGSSLRFEEVFRSLGMATSTITRSLPELSHFESLAVPRGLLWIGMGFPLWIAGTWWLVIRLDRWTQGYRRWLLGIVGMVSLLMGLIGIGWVLDY